MDLGASFGIAAGSETPVAPSDDGQPAAEPPERSGDSAPTLETRVAALERELDALRTLVAHLRPERG